MSRSTRFAAGRRPAVRAAVALTVSVALAANPAPAVAHGGHPEPAPAPAPAPQPAAAPAPAPAIPGLNDLSSLPFDLEGLGQREVNIGGVTVPVPAALAGVVAAAAVLGGLSFVIIQALTGELPGSSKGDKDQPAPAEPMKAEYANRFDFSAVNDDPAAGGFSGIDEVAPGRYVVLSDDKNEHGPVRAYVFTTTDHKTFTRDGVIEFTDPEGKAYDEFIDPEEIRVLPNGNFLWTTEGNGKPGQVVPPQLIESAPDGKEIRRIDVPGYQVPNGISTRGIYNNNGPEGMTLIDGGRTAVTVEENALAQDGAKNTEKDASANRITFYDLESGKPTRELVVKLEAGRGATSLLADDNGDLYMLQRGFFKDLGENGENKAEIYKLDLDGADDVLGKEKLDGDEKTVSKELVFDFATEKPHPDNVEGLAWGPRTEDGRRTLIVVSDNNFNETQTTYFHTVLVP